MVDSLTSLQKLQTAENQLVGAYKTVESFLANDPQKLQELKNSVKEIKNNFSKILDIKYGLTAQTIVDRLSPDQVDSLVEQLNDLTNQINAINNEITTKTQAIAQYQNQIALQTDPAQLDILNQALQAAQAQIDNAKNALYAAQDRLKELKDKLDVSQANLNQAIQLFDSLVANEKTLFQELFPNVTFPV